MEGMEKQTVVDILYKFLYEMESFEGFDPYSFNHKDVFNKAKEMEKEQMRIISIDKELFKRLPIEGTNFCSFNVNDFRYFATKYYIDNFKETFKSE
jgi:hypothetical protein